MARSTTSPGEVALLAQLALDLRRPDVGLTVARRGAENGVILFDAAFPIVDLGATGSIERALALALTKQESSFNAGAVSTSGALGLMQLLPGTARDVAGRAKVPFIQDTLTRDPSYNVQLGSQYLAEMLQRFGGSYELALAAYNAGPGRVERGGRLPAETRAYVGGITKILRTRTASLELVKLTRPNGAAVKIDPGKITDIRPALPSEYAPSVKTVVTIGRLQQGIRENVTVAINAIRATGGLL